MATLYSQDPGGNNKATVALCDQWLYELHKRILALENANTEKDETIKQLRIELDEEKIKVSKLSANPTTQQTQPTNWATAVSKTHKSPNEVLYMGWVANETREKTSKEKNIVISGIETAAGDNTESKEADSAKVKAIMDALKITNDANSIIRCVRLGSGINTEESKRPPLLLVELVNQQLAGDMLKRAIDLKNKPEFKDVYIKRDLTRNELELEKHLRKQCTEMNAALSDGEGRQRYGIQANNGRKYYHGIRFGRIEMVDKETNRILKR